MKIGVLALQGAVQEHIFSINQTGMQAVPVRDIKVLDQIQGLVIPGGESTTIGKLMKKYQFIEAIKQFSAKKRPIFGTCAGLIVMAKYIEGQNDTYLNLMNVTVKRNAFGRQRESFEADITVKGINETIRAVFIRAPLISNVGDNVEVLSRQKGEIVMVRQGHLLACSYHPELTANSALHEYFIRMVQHYCLK